MAIPVNRLPSGRGVRGGQDWYINQGEAYRTRASRSTPVGKDFLGPTQPFQAATTTQTITNNYTFLFYIGGVEEAMTYKEVRTMTNTASRTIDVALYWFDATNSVFKRIPKTKTTLDTAAFGTINKASTDVQVLPTDHLWLAVGNSSGANVAIGTTANTYRCVQAYTINDNGAVSPTYTQASLTASAATTPVVTYVSQFVKDNF